MAVLEGSTSYFSFLLALDLVPQIGLYRVVPVRVPRVSYLACALLAA